MSVLQESSGLFWCVLRFPLATFLATAAGLTAALLGDGWWHWLSWLLLAIPLAIIVAALARQSRPG